MKYEFTVYPYQINDHSFWVAESEQLKGCVGQGDTMLEAIQQLEENEAEWLDSAAKYSIPIPEIHPHEDPSYSGKVTLRISPLTHKEASQRAKRFGISLNQYLNDAVVSYNAK